MSNSIPRDKISDIRHAADIVEVASDAVMLKKSGKNFLGLCPFHSEKTPSFTVSPDKQMYYCFGCGAGGDVFAFLMEHDGLSFPEAARLLARRYGVDLPEGELSPEEKERISLRENLFAINREAKKFFTENLRGSVGKPAMAYLKNRGIADDVIQAFDLGFAPDDWDRLLRFLAGKRISMSLVKTAGLIVPRKEKPGFYDRFRNRIIFPIADIRGQVSGFGGRVMDDGGYGVPKYLNSPESPIYHKSRSLYGLHKTRRRCREQESVFLVEGYFDVLALWAHGIENCAATLGTSLTPDHVRMLKAVASEIVLVYDSDAAGLNAAARSVPIFDAEQVDARIMTLPKGHDPDTFVRQEGPEAFQEAARNALGVIQFMMESAIRTHGLSIEGRVRVIADMIPPIKAIKDGVKRSLYVQALADRTQVPEEQIFQKLRDENDPQQQNRQPHPEPPETSVNKKEWRIERMIVAMMLQCPDMIPEIRDRGVVNHFKNNRLADIGRTVLAHGDQIDSCLDTLFEDPENQRMAAALSLKEEPWDPAGCRRLLDQFESGLIAAKEKSLVQRIREAERQNDKTLLMKLLKEKQRR